MHDALGIRIKRNYEHAYRIKLPMRMPVILRIDGKAFSRYTRTLEKPFDNGFIGAMNATAITLCEQIQGAQIAYLQSDEINILLHNYKRLNSSAWFDNNIQKMVSVSAAIASACMTELSSGIFKEMRKAFFDSRAFVLPESEVNNYYTWRQQDCTRNSIQMVARSVASHKECDNLNQDELQELIFQKSGKNWNDLPTYLKRGRCIHKQYVTTKINNIDVNRSIWTMDPEIPIFHKEPNYIEKHLETLE